ncbi:MAG: PorP/SprF family type IX secretion system membrane protein [Bacteroidales bacterium]|nr:PorP/SprF family type IX secretion system membrane protein [Bacteroidales bacterium]
MKKLIGFLVVFFFVSEIGTAQIAHYSQFYSTPMTIAPSFAGLTEASRLSLNYRDQWPAIPGVFRTYSAGVDNYFKRAKSGVGLLVFRDVAGAGKLGLTEASLLYSYKIKVGQKRGNINSEWFLRPGIQFKYSQRSIDFEALTFGDQLLDNQPYSVEAFPRPPSDKPSYIDFAASLLAYTDLYWGGFSVDHLLRPTQSFLGYRDRMSMKWSIFGGAKILLQDKQRRRVRYGRDIENVTFAFNYQYWDHFDQLDIGAYWTHDPLILGAWFRGIPIIDKKDKTFNNIDAIIVLVGFKLTPDLKIGYSYDMTIIRNLFSHTGGAHEISLVYEFNKNLDRRFDKHTIIPCPDF